ncbi:hypothetical protein FV139_02615 [Parahaliea maris]|uniref:Uncharacterized protein n=1 Tax=Parahaliea maris TaxID=2716870 RepID=A0A5C9A8N4_9GAMM|nr:hypothetical protein [Parahaliea maris]TXS96404.1 hypothetical protein FV139_02615 [Parahaliea maris]
MAFIHRVVPLLGILSSLSPMAHAAPLSLSDDNVCAWTLQQVTGSELEAETVVFDSYDEFGGTKAEASPLRVKQFRSPEGGPARSVACKLSSVEGLIEKAGVDPALLGTQQSCRVAHQRMLDSIYQALPPAERRLSPGDFVLEEDETAWTGPTWLRPNPYPALVPLPDGRYSLRAKSLAVVNEWYVPLPSSIKGVHYCTLVAPEYLRAVLRGDRQ